MLEETWSSPAHGAEAEGPAPGGGNPLSLRPPAACGALASGRASTQAPTDSPPALPERSGGGARLGNGRARRDALTGSPGLGLGGALRPPGNIHRAGREAPHTEAQVQGLRGRKRSAQRGTHHCPLSPWREESPVHHACPRLGPGQLWETRVLGLPCMLRACRPAGSPPPFQESAGREGVEGGREERSQAASRSTVPLRPGPAPAQAPQGPREAGAEAAEPERRGRPGGHGIRTRVRANLGALRFAGRHRSRPAGLWLQL